MWRVRDKFPLSWGGYTKGVLYAGGSYSDGGSYMPDYTAGHV